VKILFSDKIRILYKYFVSLQSKFFRYNTDTIWINTFVVGKPRRRRREDSSFREERRARQRGKTPNTNERIVI